MSDGDLLSTKAGRHVPLMRPSETYLINPFNPLKLIAHRERVEKMLAGEPVFPVSVELDLSLKCNHACAWCSFDKFRLENWVDFPAPRVLSLLDELKECGVKSVTLTGGGEPLVHKSAGDVMLKLAALGLKWGLVTNGFNLRGELRELVARYATFCRVSLDAGTSETHQAIHAAPMPQFERILENIRQTVYIAKGRPGDPLTMGASFCCFDRNVSELPLAAKALHDAGANYIEVRPVYPTTWRGGGQDESALTRQGVAVATSQLNATRSVYRNTPFRVIGMIDRFEALEAFRHKDFYDACRITDLTTVISSDGQIYACCVHRGLPAFKGGSVLDAPFREVWLSQQRTAMRDAIDIDKCPRCRYVGLNSVIQSAVMNDGLHADFI